MPYLGNEVAPLVQALEGKELKLDSDGDSSITADTDDRVDVKVGGSDKVHVTSTGLGVGTSSPDGALHVKGMSDHGRIFLESGGTSGSDNNMFMQFHNGSGTEIAQIEVAEGASNEGQIVFKTGGTTTAMTIDKDGHITKPLQSAFLVNPATAGSSPVQTNISSNDAITFGNEVFDQNSDFGSNTFTAPVTGKYQFNVGLFLEQVDTDYSELRIKLDTSNRTYDHFDIGSPFSSDRNLQYHLSALADMDASDTAVLRVTFGGGGNQMDVNALTYFSGYLVC